MHITTGARTRDWGSVAVDGLIAGTVAGVIMAGYLLVATGENPVDLLSRFAAGNTQGSPVTGALAHLAMSMIYGMGFTLIWHALKGSSRSMWRIISGIVYAGLLFGISEYALLPAFQSPLLGIPVLHWGIGHAIYGVVLGLMTRRS